MATIKTDITLKHQANLGEEIKDVTFVAGDEIEILQEWGDRYLGKSQAGEVFNFPRDAVDA